MDQKNKKIKEVRRFQLLPFQNIYSGKNVDAFKYKIPREVCRIYYCVDDEWGDDRGDL